MARAALFPPAVVAAFDRAKIIGVRAGDDHRFTGVWVVVHDGRVYVRSWNDKPTGWYRAFLRQPTGYVQLDARELPVRTRVVRSPVVRAAVSSAYAAKYDTKASLKWVTGFAEPGRAAHTLELIPPAAG